MIGKNDRIVAPATGDRGVVEDVELLQHGTPWEERHLIVRFDGNDMVTFAVNERAVVTEADYDG